MSSAEQLFAHLSQYCADEMLVVKMVRGKFPSFRRTDRKAASELPATEEHWIDPRPKEVKLMSAMENNNAIFVKALDTGRGPEGFIWGNNWKFTPGANFADQAARVERVQEAEIEPRYVQRDACTYCGVRADVGCKHQQAAA